ncbi:MAG: SGNH/GDSL hydrolase family protein [Oscillospiraceae bacterium]|nr:SGNH/GDSL hydrolase family protein [Oscillospiraceae bacterium]
MGDSLASGEFEAVGPNGETTYHDMFDYSWGQFLARMAGCTALNFSRGGMTAREYWESFAAENGFWDGDKACQAYIVALGVNDLLNEHIAPGDADNDVDPDDETRNAKTFAGYYGAILTRLQRISPGARFFLMTMPRNDRETEEGLRMKEIHTALLHRFAQRFPRTYVLDFFRYCPIYDDAFFNAFYMGGHLNPCGYLLTAKMIASYIDYLIRQDPASFRDVGFIGTGLHAAP